MGRTLVMGDLHGGYKALMQCLQRSNFDYNNDTLIQLGDVCDGWNQVYECIDELVKIKNLISIKGNHDEWFYQWMIKGEHPMYWLQGGEGTLASYCNHAKIQYYASMGAFKSSLTILDIPQSHKNFITNQKLYHIDEKNRLFVHGGYNRTEHLDYVAAIKPHELYWDRSLWQEAMSCSKEQKLKTADNFNEIFIGHTSTTFWKTDKPMISGGVWNLDTGGGWSGKLTIMNLETKEYWQSDNVKELYIDQKGRN